MADNFDFTEGSGKTGSADDVGGVLYPRVKLDIGTDGVGTPVLGGAGAVAAGVPRITLASDDPAVALLGTIDTDTGVIAGDTTSIDGKITACNTGAVVLATGSAAIGKLAANSGVDIGDVDILSIAAGDNNIGNVDIVTVPAPLNVVGGGTEATALRVTLANDSTGVITVDGTVTANLSAVDNAVLDTIDAVLDQIELNTDPLLVVGGGAEATAIRVTIANDSTGLVSIDDGGGAITVDGTVTANLSATDNAVLDTIDAVLDTINAKLVTGTVIGDVNLGATDNAVLDAVAASLVTIDSDTNDIKTAVELLDNAVDGNYLNVNINIAGTDAAAGEGVISAQTQRVTIATDDDGVVHLATIAGDTTNIETAIQIIDDWDSTHDSAASADGPQLMAAYDATKPTAVADGDAVRVLADEYGRLLAGVEPQHFEAVYDSGDATAEAEVVHASAASTIIVVQSYVISSDVEGWIKLQDEDSTAKTGKFWLKAGGGVAITLPDKAPIVLGVDKDLEVIAEAAGNVSVSVTGYTIPG